MLYRHADDDLQRLENDPEYEGGWARNIVRAFRLRMDQIREAPHENALRALKSLHFEKLKGDRQGQYSMRLNQKYRLIFEIEESPHGHVIVVIGIEDYH